MTELSHILSATAQAYEIEVADLKGPSRQPYFAIPRMIYCYLARKHTDASYPKIADQIGNRHHTTAMHGETKIDEMLATKDRAAERVADELEAIMLSAGAIAEVENLSFKTRRINAEAAA